jgi:branched-chain amino acid transport system ATP-binding protein
LFAVIGPNGAGKTSLFNVLSRVYQSAAGQVMFDGRDLQRFKTYQVARAGIARTFQNLGQFPTMTVLDYLLLGRHTRMRSGIIFGGIYLGLTRNEEKRNRAYCLHLLDLMGLQRLQNQPLGSLPYGLQKRADIARALALEPKLLLLDEPVAGMGLEETEDIAAAILDIKEQLGITQILVEHDMALVMGIADSVSLREAPRLKSRPILMSLKPTWAKSSAEPPSLSPSQLKIMARSSANRRERKESGLFSSNSLRGYRVRLHLRPDRTGFLHYF